MASFERASKNSLYFLKGITRVIAKMFIEAVHRVSVNIFDTLFGFLNWPGKKIRIQIFILRDPDGNAVISSTDLDASIDYAKRIFKKHFNVTVLAHHKGSFAELVPTIPPIEVLNTKGGPAALREEFKIAGSYFGSNLSGVLYPVTIFVVIKIRGASGCSLGPMSDYVTLDPFGAKQTSVLAHELAHACGLWHINDKANLLYPYNKRGDEVKWWQKNIFRSSRHVTYW